jgi:hypothetical protein
VLDSDQSPQVVVLYPSLWYKEKTCQSNINTVD